MTLLTSISLILASCIEIMFDTFKKYLEDKITLTNPDYELIESLSSFKKLRKRQYLLQAGDVCRFNIFVLKGFLRLYYLDDRTHEHIMQFAPENYWTGDRESMESGLPSKYTIDAIEDSEILLLKKEDFEMIRKTVPAFNEFINDTLKKMWRFCRNGYMPAYLFLPKKNTATLRQNILLSAIVYRYTWLHLTSAYLLKR